MRRADRRDPGKKDAKRHLAFHAARESNRPCPAGLSARIFSHRLHCESPSSRFAFGSHPRRP